MNFEQIMDLPGQYGPLIRALNQSETEFPAFYRDRFLLLCADDGRIIGRGCSARFRDLLTRLRLAPGFSWGAGAAAITAGAGEPVHLDHTLSVIGRQLPFADGVHVFMGAEVDPHKEISSRLSWDWGSELLIRNIAQSARWHFQEMEQHHFETEKDKLETFHSLTSELAELKSPEEILTTVADRVTQLMDAGTTIVYGTNPARTRLVPLVGHHIETAELQSVRYEIEAGANLVARAYHSGRVTFGDSLVPLDQADSIPALHSLGLASILVVPISLHDEPLGVMVVGRYIERPFDTSQAEVLAFVARQIALILKNARLQAQLSHRLEAINQEMSLARGMQALMLPKEPLTAGRVKVAGSSWPAKHLGGDYFDYFERDGRLNVIVADIVGKGVSAALLMSILRSHFRSVLWEEPLGPSALNRINRLIYQDFRPQRAFATALLMSLDLQTCELTLVAAGHPVPLVAREGALIEPFQTGAPSLGLFDRPIRDSAFHTMQLQGADTLLAYSDGATDTIGECGERFGPNRLTESYAAAVLRHEDPCAILETVVEDIRRFTVHQPDDTTVCVWRVAPSLTGARHE